MNAANHYYRPDPAFHKILAPVPAVHIAPKQKPEFYMGQEGDEPIPMEPNLQKVYKVNYILFDPNKPRTPEKELSSPDDEYRLDLNDSFLLKIYNKKIEEKKVLDLLKSDNKSNLDVNKTQELEVDNLSLDETKLGHNILDVCQIFESESTEEKCFPEIDQVMFRTHLIENNKQFSSIENILGGDIAISQTDSLNPTQKLFQTKGYEKVLGEVQTKNVDETENYKESVARLFFDQASTSKKSSYNSFCYSDLSQFKDESIDKSQLSQQSAKLSNFEEQKISFQQHEQPDMQNWTDHQNNYQLEAGQTVYYDQFKPDQTSYGNFDPYSQYQEAHSIPQDFKSESQAQAQAQGQNWGYNVYSNNNQNYHQTGQEFHQNIYYTDGDHQQPQTRQPINDHYLENQNDYQNRLVDNTFDQNQNQMNNQLTTQMYNEDLYLAEANQYPEYQNPYQNN